MAIADVFHKNNQATHLLSVRTYVTNRDDNKNRTRNIFYPPTQTDASLRCWSPIGRSATESLAVHYAAGTGRSGWSQNRREVHTARMVVGRRLATIESGQAERITASRSGEVGTRGRKEAKRGKPYWHGLSKGTAVSIRRFFGEVPRKELAHGFLGDAEVFGELRRRQTKDVRPSRRTHG